MIEKDTIAALSTPPGTGAIALLRLSGSEALAILRTVVPDLPPTLAPRTAHLADLLDAEGTIDEGLVTWFRAPASYTGEEMVEIGVHGSPYIQQRLLTALLAGGARLARPGEFTLRAFLNRKMDLSQAEAVADLIGSAGKAAHTLALQQLRGGYSQRMEGLRQELIDLCALVELELDFSEEDVEFAERGHLVALIEKISAICTDLIASFAYGNAIRSGVPVAILGAPNSGKSTLLNALLQEDRAIVSDIPGTTRDTVEETLTIEGVLFRFIDTAGLRSTADVIENLGIERSYKKAAEASVVLLLGDASTLSEEALRQEGAALQQRIGAMGQVLLVMNKADLSTTVFGADILAISALKEEGLNSLRAQLLDHVRALHSGSGEIVVSNVRHVEALRQAREALQEARKAIDQGLSGELLAIDLRKAQHHLGEITGRITTEDLLGSIFGRFCIGK